MKVDQDGFSRAEILASGQELRVYGFTHGMMISGYWQGSIRLLAIIYSGEGTS